MKHQLYILFAVISLLTGMNLKAQPLSNDTVICLIDTTQSYVHFKVQPHAPRHFHTQWQVAIDGHYYDHDSLHHDFACIVLGSVDLKRLSRPQDQDNLELKVAKQDLIKHHQLFTEEWINQQKDLYALRKVLGITRQHKYNFLIFKQDFENIDCDSVTMHRVEIGYNEFQY